MTQTYASHRAAAREGAQRPDAPPRTSAAVPVAYRQLLPLLLLVVIVGAGAFVRLSRLGEANFRHDEVMMYHTGRTLSR